MNRRAWCAMAGAVTMWSPGGAAGQVMAPGVYLFHTPRGQPRITGLDPAGRYASGWQLTDTNMGDAARVWGIDGSAMTITNGGQPLAEAWGVSAGGAFVAGRGMDTVLHVDHAFHWSAATGQAVFMPAVNGRIASTVAALSGDGSTVVGSVYGSSSEDAFRWRPGSAPIVLPRLPLRVRGTATDVSGDGSRVVGFCNRADAVSPLACLWEPNNSVVALGVLPGEVSSFANAISLDGTTVVGVSGNLPWVWRQSTGMVPLPSGVGVSDVSGDGRVIVGRAPAAPNEIPQASVYDPERGARSLKRVLLEDFGIDTDGVYLRDATAVSADGTVIVGRAVSGTQTYGYFAVIPGVGTTAAAVLAGAVWVAPRRRR